MVRGLAFLLALLAAPVALPAQAAFIRGEFNGDRQIDISDPVAILFHLFEGEFVPQCLSAGDLNDDAVLDVTDVVNLLGFLFQQGGSPAAPYPECGEDPTPGEPGCVAHPCGQLDVDPEITEWIVPWPDTRPRDPYVDGQGRVWFVGQGGDYAAYLSVGSGEFTRFPLEPGTGPHNLIVGDYVWYSGNLVGHIGRLDPESGEILTFPMPNPAARDPHTLVFDQGGEIWFSVQGGNFVGRFSTVSGQIRLITVPTASANPYGIVIDSRNRPWVSEFGTYKLGLVDREAMTIKEFPLPRTAARPRRLMVTSDDQVWYVDHAQGYLGRLDPETGAAKEWRTPAGVTSRPYGMAVDDLDRLWFVETGPRPSRFVGFNPKTEAFFSNLPIKSGGGVRHMYFHRPTRQIWFGTDSNTIGRAALK